MQESFEIYPLRDDLTLFIRLFRPSDINQILIGFDKLSDRSRYRRFLNPVKRLPETNLHDLLNVDNTDILAVCAGVIHADGWEGAGIARFSRSVEDAESAEIGLTIIDKYQGRGIGSLLFQSLTRHALDCGIRNFSGSLLTDNTSMIKILRHYPIQSRLEEGPVIQFNMPIDQSSVPAVLESARVNSKTIPWFEGMH